MFLFEQMLNISLENENMKKKKKSCESFKSTLSMI